MIHSKMTAGKHVSCATEGYANRAYHKGDINAADQQGSGYGIEADVASRAWQQGKTRARGLYSLAMLALHKNHSDGE